MGVCTNSRTPERFGTLLPMYGEPSEQIHVIQDRIAKTFRGGGKVSPGIVEDVLKIR